MQISNIDLLRRKYLFVSLLLLCISVIGRLYVDTFHIQSMLDKNTKEFNNQLNSFFNESLNSLNDKYATISDVITLNTNTQEMIKQRNRIALHEYIETYYNSLQKDDKDLYVMHFFDTSNITILRMHKPQSFDDNLTEKRPIVKYVNNAIEKSYGFEVGKNGITYRITSPIVDNNNEHLGALEFGINPTFFAHKLEKRFDAKVLVLVKTDALNLLVDKKDYKTLGSYSVMNKDKLFNKFIPLVDISKEFQILQNDTKTYMIYNNLTLNSYDNRIMARILMLKDISKFTAENNELIFLSSLINLIALLSIGSIIYIMLHKYTNALQSLLVTNNLIRDKVEMYKTKANTDNLTKLYNREFLETFWNTQNFSDEKENVCILFDIDYFKKVNDNYGHDVGDTVLQHLADLSRSFFREEDVIIRYGGEEFLIFLKCMNYQDGYKKAEEFRRFISEECSFSNDIHVTLSLGVTKFEVNEKKNDVIKRADKALYKAKENGRDQVVLV